MRVMSFIVLPGGYLGPAAVVFASNVLSFETAEETVTV